ncbi:hypothetical protein B0A48_11146 [Cryoendolithus antarcticus]|uniref:C2H2-type domain-containing protein n=1 Tax=Cryoendolithus antarcticus TaxID=1507870 RepID=A0A1V8SUM3_9PEZI|nr:hypothetical protein B0A48_11146 [Cryoendolithus antarcticus]
MSTTPSIRISQHHRYPSPYASYSASPIPVPMAQEPVPPPLPPPSNIAGLTSGRDPGWQWGNDPDSLDFGRAAPVQPGSSLLGSGSSKSKHLGSMRLDQRNDNRRGSSISTVTGTGQDCEMADDHNSDEDGSKRNSNYRLQSERRLEQTTLEGSSQAYDKQLLSRIGGPSTPNSRRQSSVSFPANMQDPAQMSLAESERRNSQLRPLAMPSHERRHSSITSIDSPGNGRWAVSVPASGAISPGFSGFWDHGASGGSSRAQTRNGSLVFEDSASHRGSYDHSMFVNEASPMDDDHMSGLVLHDRSPSGSDDYANGKAGVKRRASSPPRDLQYIERTSVSSASGAPHNDLYHRRSMQSMQQLPNRGSPVSRYHPNHGSLSSASSWGPRHGSLGSSLSIPSIPSSATSYASGRLSPGGLSPAIDPELRSLTPISATRDMNISPGTAAVYHQRHVSAENGHAKLQRAVADTEQSPRQPLSPQSQGAFMCECCPKKPKKFDSEDDLRTHEAEKQYTCAYCPNRFKNKNEAERHQNSLHLRHHSWSCATLSGPEAAYHASFTGRYSDICGYCGEDFPNPPDLAARSEHLNTVHKFGECNKTKKFFRADHFRQHLKHSHAGTSGKWTNMLENACMKDEPLPEKRSVAAGQLGPPALVVTTSGLAGQVSRSPSVGAEETRS